MEKWSRLVMDKERGRKKKYFTRALEFYALETFPLVCLFVHSHTPTMIHSLPHSFFYSEDKACAGAQTPFPTHESISFFTKSPGPDPRGQARIGQAQSGDVRLVSLPPLQANRWWITSAST